MSITATLSHTKHEAYLSSVGYELNTLESVVGMHEVEAAISRLVQAVDRPIGDHSSAALVRKMVGHEPLSPLQSFHLESENTARYFSLRADLLDGALTATQVAALLQTSRQTPHDRVKANTLIALMDRGKLRFPTWQFDPQAPSGVVAGLPETLKALSISDFAKISWLSHPHPALNNRTPIEALKQGDLDRVLTLAYGVGAN